MLPESRIFTFLDSKKHVNVYFLEGQNLVHELALIHPIKPTGFSYLREMVLSFQPLMIYCKPNEGVSLFLDSEQPRFQIGLETNSQGLMRALLLPENFDRFPQRMSGQARLTKIFYKSQVPYTSILKIENKTFTEVVNLIFKESYQFNSSVHVSELTDQSILINQLPPLNPNLVGNAQQNAQDYWDNHQEQFKGIFKKNITEEKLIIKEFDKIGLIFLGSQEINFKCNCSRERMILGVLSLGQVEVQKIFEEAPGPIETKCDYCKTFYHITEEELVLYLKKEHH